jgi:citrate lyase subunit beta / citryl-CoA lyase
MTTALESARTFLFVPGTRPDRFDKAVATGADAVILDLEDAVGADDKPLAREDARAWLEAGGRAVVRVNGRSTPWFAEDVAAAARAVAIMLPKAESPEDVAAVRAALDTDVPVLALVETARGVAAVRDICRAPGVARVAFGNVDLAAGLGVEPTARDALLAARSALVYASAEAGCAPPVDGPTLALDDEDRLADETAYARGLGFTARLCIHPRQVAVVARVLAPDEDELAWARAVLAAASGGVSVHDGQMVDEPVLARARRLVEAERTGP